MKRILYGLGACGAIVYAYFKGYYDGLHKEPLVEEINSEETDTNAESKSVENEETEEEYECQDEECSDTFETEHGRNIHMGIAHSEDS